MEKKTDKILRGKGKILLMNDEDIIRESVGGVLNHLGYEVELARDGAEVIEIYKKARKSRQPFDTVIMDLLISGEMGCKEAIQELIEIDPEVKAIVSSGYSNHPVMADYRKYGFSAAIAKPYTIKELSEILHKVIMGIGE